MFKEYKDERINELIKKSFELAVRDNEWKLRYLQEWNILFEDIDKMLEYVENGYKGELRVNSNMWYILKETLVKILALYDLQLIGEEKVSENELVVPISKIGNIKEKIFEKMQEYGWNLGNNTYKDFADVYDIHYGFIDSLYDYFREQEEIGKSIDLNDISEEGLFETIVFMSDFLRALNDIDIPKTKEDKIREYIMSRNIQYDLVGEDLLAILDEEE